MSYNSYENSTGNISIEKSPDNSPKAFDISFPKIHRNSSKHQSLIIDQEIKEEQNEDGKNTLIVEENSPYKKIKSTSCSNIFMHKLNLIESQCLVNLKIKSFTKPESPMDNITEVKEESSPNMFELHKNLSAQSPRIKLMTDNVEDISFSRNYYPSSPSRNLEKNQIINEDFEENLEEIDLNKKSTFSKFDNFVDKSENFASDEKKKIPAIIEEIQEEVIEEEYNSSPKNINKKSNDFMRNNEPEFKENFNISYHKFTYDEEDEIKEVDEKKID